MNLGSKSALLDLMQSRPPNRLLPSSPRKRRRSPRRAPTSRGGALHKRPSPRSRQQGRRRAATGQSRVLARLCFPHLCRRPSRLRRVPSFLGPRSSRGCQRRRSEDEAEKVIPVRRAAPSCHPSPLGRSCHGDKVPLSHPSMLARSATSSAISSSPGRDFVRLPAQSLEHLSSEQGICAFTFTSRSSTIIHSLHSIQSRH